MTTLVFAVEMAVAATFWAAVGTVTLVVDGVAWWVVDGWRVGIHFEDLDYEEFNIESWCFVFDS